MKATDAKLYSLYFHELLWHAVAIQQRCERVFAETEPPSSGHFIKVDPELHSVISAILVDAANIKKLLITSEKRQKNESQGAFRLRQARARILRTSLAPVHLEEMFNAKVRNSIEHFDEYLDEANVELETALDNPPLAAYNMTISSWRIMDPRPYPVRLYVADEKRFYNLKYQVDLGRIHGEAVALTQHLKTLDELRGIEAPRGVMLPLETRAEAAGKPPITLRRTRG